ncbi:type I glutamate--ammonia ligase [Paenibacillus flagellatus]|uniref:Glutamine synthetase n=1 Tax=Paenibacillus flagellatus TaxID=2211139 RepID=A0A2V5KE59_9BACL|nr:type I glutamate--ammonia ligase [Paenibacillus flagellatus]PYI57332.1 type I glutamate--ammonia ligase [Paenibacillus flagellatus]
MTGAGVADAKSRLEDVRERLGKRGAELLGLQFADLFGAIKTVYVHRDEFDSALAGKTMFDGSSVPGFARVERSELLLLPDPETIRFEPAVPEERGVAYAYCDVLDADGEPAACCSRTILKRALREAEKLGYTLNVGIEGEFFLFETDDRGEPIHVVHDRAGYFDGGPSDRGERARLDIVAALRRQGFRLEAAHHEVAPGQHEIDFKYGDAMTAADRWMTFRQIVKQVAHRHGLHASFMPKPFAGQNGNAMHCNQSLQRRDGSNAFFDASRPDGLSETARRYIGGLLRHAQGMAAIANPIVNSYKRLLPGYEAPTHIAWSSSNRSALVRVPSSRGAGTRVELRTPDPAANPYLVLAVMLRAGLEGIASRIEPPAEVVGNIHDMSDTERRDARIGRYPRDLHEAVEAMMADPLVRETLGDAVCETYASAKRREADEYAAAVHGWEIERYLARY